MSVHSNYYEDEEEYRRDLAWEYRTEQAGLYVYDDDMKREPTCGDCQYCKTGKRFTFEITDIYGKEPGRDVPRRELYVHEDRNRMTFMNICVRDLEHIKQVKDYDKACPEAIEEGAVDDGELEDDE